MYVVPFLNYTDFDYYSLHNYNTRKCQLDIAWSKAIPSIKATCKLRRFMYMYMYNLCLFCD